MEDATTAEDVIQVDYSVMDATIHASGLFSFFFSAAAAAHLAVMAVDAAIMAATAVLS